jgi:hypothetical protein
MSINFLPAIPNNYPTEWAKVEGKSVDPTTPYVFFIYLINSEEKLLSDFLDISNPKSARYGNYLNYNQISEYLIDPSIVDLIRNDILAKIPDATIVELLSGDILQVSAKALDVENYFQTTLSYYQLIKSSSGYTPSVEILRVSDPEKPLLVSDTFAKYVEFVTPLYFFPYIKSVPREALGRFRFSSAIC